MCESKLACELFHGHGPLDRIEIGSMDVLNEGPDSRILIRGMRDDGRDFLPPKVPARSPTPLACDQLEMAGFAQDRAYYNWLEQPCRSDGFREILNGRTIKVPPWLAGIWCDAAQLNAKDRAE